MQKTIVSLIDDLDGSEAVETVTFSVRGVVYEIDLSAENAAELDARFAEYTQQARRVSGSTKRAATPRQPFGRGKGTATAKPDATPKRTEAERQRAADIRAWAKEMGIKCAERGRIGAAAVKAYDDAHQEPTRAKADRKPSKPKATRARAAKAPSATFSG